jgi:hypothetical protein
MQFGDRELDLLRISKSVACAFYTLSAGTLLLWSLSVTTDKYIHLHTKILEKKRF